jgi:hypothetical protein
MTILCTDRVELDNTSLKTALQMEEEKFSQHAASHREEIAELNARLAAQKVCTD